MATNEKNVRANRAHIHNLIRARLEWMEGDIPLNLIDPLSDYGMTLTTEVGNTTYTLVRCDGELALYRIAENGYPQTIASSLETPELVPELTGLYRSARRHYEEWIETERKMYYRRHFGPVVSIRELFAALDRPAMIAIDVADEMCYRSLRADDDEKRFLALRHHIYKNAIHIIKKIVTSTGESNNLLPIYDSCPVALYWKAGIPKNLAAAKTDILYRLRPDYQELDDDTKCVIVEMAAKIILLSAV